MRKINWKKISSKQLAAIINEEFKKNSIEVILVGGTCVTIYSDAIYQSYDLDYVTYENHNKVKKILENIGFFEKNRYFVHKECPYFIEFVTPPVAIGIEPVKEFNYLKTKMGEIVLLSPTDCVKDRLAAFFHWNDLQSFNQAIMVANKQKIDFSSIKKWAKKENCLEKYKEFYKALKKKQK